LTELFVAADDPSDLFHDTGLAADASEFRFSGGSWSKGGWGWREAVVGGDGIDQEEGLGSIGGL